MEDKLYGTRGTPYMSCHLALALALALAPNYMVWRTSCMEQEVHELRSFVLCACMFLPLEAYYISS